MNGLFLKEKSSPCGVPYVHCPVLEQMLVCQISNQVRFFCHYGVAYLSQMFHVATQSCFNGKIVTNYLIHSIFEVLSD